MSAPMKKVVIDRATMGRLARSPVFDDVMRILREAGIEAVEVDGQGEAVSAAHVRAADPCAPDEIRLAAGWVQQVCDGWDTPPTETPPLVGWKPAPGVAGMWRYQSSVWAFDETLFVWLRWLAPRGVDDVLPAPVVRPHWLRDGRPVCGAPATEPSAHQLAMGADKIERLEEEVADLERRLAATKHIPPASRMGWFVCCIVDSRGETVGSFHLHVPGGATISEVVRREAKHHLQTHVVRGKRPVRYVVIPTTADLCTIGPEVEVRIVEPDEVSHG